MACTKSFISSPSRTIIVVFIALSNFLATQIARAAITVSISPAAITLNPLAVQRFSATVSGTTNSGVSWSLAPQIGTLTSAGGTAAYVAPATINAKQTVTITATSLADNTTRASATVQLTPLVSISLSPGSVTMPPAGTQQFTAAVLGTTNQVVNWSVQPNVGSISSSGLYTAPQSVSAAQTVTVTAQSAQDPTKTATANVTVTSGVTFTMGPSGLTSLKWNNQDFLYRGVTTPSFAWLNLANPAGYQTPTTPLQTVVNQQNGTITLSFSWGTATTQYQAIGNKLLMTVTIKNTSSQSINRYWMFPLALQFPATPVNTTNNMSFNMDAPSSVLWNYVTGTADLVNEDVIQPLSLGFWAAESPAASRWWVSLNVDPTQSLNPNWPAINRPIPAGGTDTLTTSLRFGPPGATDLQMAGDIYARYAATYPRIFTAPAPRKPMARLSFNGKFRPTYPKNPRGWFNDPSIDVTTSQGIATFQSRLLAAADSAVAEMTRMGAAGGIIWDIEGQQLDQTFIGDPSQAETLAPELVGVLDAFMAKFKSAGLPIGFTLRPQVFSVQKGTINVSGTNVTWAGGAQFSSAWVNQPAGGEITIGGSNYMIASVQSPTSLTLRQSAGTANAVPYLYGLQTNTANPYGVLYTKAQYAKQRWGATLFYVDCDLDYKGNMTPAAVFQQLTQTLPGTAYFPEWKTPRDYAYTYGFLDSTNGIVSPDPLSMNLYPNAAGLVRVPNDANIGAMQNTLIKSVSAGNILLFDGWYRHPGNDVVSLIYALAP